MIRVLHVLPDFAVGGGQLLLLRTLAAMPEVDHVVVALRPGPMADAFRRDGHRVVVLGSAGPLGLAPVLPRAVRLVRRQRVDLVHLNNTWQDRVVGQLAALPWGVPVVSTLHGTAPDRSRWNVPRHVNRAVARRHVRHFLAVSDHVAASYRGALGLAEATVSVVNPGLADDAFAPVDPALVAATRAGLGLAASDEVVLCVARLVPGKGHDALVGMLDRLRERRPGVRLVLAGDGPLRPAVQAEVDRLGLSRAVLLLGQRRDVPVLLALADVVVSASTSEGFPLNVLEALAASRPLVAAPLPALAELAEAGALLISDGPDADRLAATVDALLADPAAAQHLARTGRATAERYRSARTAAGWRAVYERVLGDGATAPVDPPAATDAVRR